MFSFFSRSKKSVRVPFASDLHSHLLPGLDDGVKTFDEAVRVINILQELGFQRAITTPHVMSDSYRNTTEGIISKQNELNTFLKKSNISFEVNAAAEYYLDEVLLERIESGYPLLTFGKNYLLFETNYLTEPYILKDFIFRATTKGYLPVLAHPERYHFMTLAKAEDLVDRGVLLQANLLSLCGYYAKPIQRMVEKLIEKKWIHFLGSDCHNLEHATKLADAFRSKAGKKALDLPLLNYTL